MDQISKRSMLIFFTFVFSNVPVRLPAISAAQVESPVSSVDVFGARSIEGAEILNAANILVGVPMQQQPAEIEARLEAMEGIEEARVSTVFLGSSVAVFIGVQEPGASPPKLRPRPTEDLRLPAKIVEAYDRGMKLLMEALQKGQASEDHADGHALAAYEPLRQQQLLLADYSKEYLAELTDVLHRSKEDHHRAVAAHTLGYVEDKSRVMEALLFATSDASSVVRNNATRALTIISQYAAANPDLDLEIDPAPFLRMLESPIWTDRNKGSAVIASMTRTRDPELLALLEARSLPYLKEMALWKSTGHAGFALQALARVAGVSEEEIQRQIDRLHAQEEGFQEEWVAELMASIELEQD